MSQADSNHNRRESVEPLLPNPATQSNETTTSDRPEEPNAPLANMGLSYSTAKIVAPLSFLIDFAAQQVGMMGMKPNMKDLHDKYPASFSPQPFAILGFFGPQQIVQLFWLRELWRSESQVEKGTLRYAPWYALGNTCIAVWMLLWTGNDLKGSFIPVFINTITQVYYLFALRNKNPQTYQSKLTNIVNITFAGVGLLDLFHNFSAEYYPGVRPNTIVQVLTALSAPLTALASPLLFGACIAYDLFGVAVGQHQLAQKALDGFGGGGGESWAKLVGAVGLVTAGVVGVRGWGGARWL